MARSKGLLEYFPTSHQALPESTLGRIAGGWPIGHRHRRPGYVCSVTLDSRAGFSTISRRRRATSLFRRCQGVEYLLYSYKRMHTMD